MKKSVMRKYAKLAVHTGVALKKGQGCIINAQVDQHEFAEMVAEEAYRAGAKWVTVNWGDQQLTKLKYRHETVTQLCRVEDWEVAQMKLYADVLPARISIASADPDGLKGINPMKMQKANIARGTAMKPLRDKMDGNFQWTILAVPSKKWARKVFPGERTSTAVEKLWEAILSTCRVSETNDPVAEWAEHQRILDEKATKLSQYDFDYLHYQSKSGTDFKCWLIPGSHWIGGGETLADGTFFVPNMPTEEIFNTPIRGKCEGKLVSTLPLSAQGTLIEKFSITFKDGKAVSVKADQGQEILERMIAMDEGACMLGELALVPVDSPISNSGILFYNTLFDENTACHVALGRGFNENIPGYRDMTKEELTEKGVNDSIIHVDFMIGSKDLNITGYTRDGKAVQVFKNGNWAL